MWNTLTKWALRALLGAGGLAGAALTLLYLFQERILYVPIIPGVPKGYSIPPERYGLHAEDIDIVADDGCRLHAWLLGLKQWTPEFTRDRPVILFFQENAGSMSFRLPYLRMMVHRLACPVLAVSYRGYGLSSGRPNERGLKLDAAAALRYVRGREDLDGSRVVVFGRSLGGAVGLHLVASSPGAVAAVIIENTFTSVEEMVSRVVPPLGLLIGPGKPLNWLVTNKWHNRDVIRSITSIPMMMIISELDEMVPPKQMYRLYRLQRASHCSLLEVPGAHHMDAASHDEYWPAVQQFMQQHVEHRR